MLLTYQEVRDRIYLLARRSNLRVDWSESGRTRRTIRLYDSGQVLMAKAEVPVRDITARKLDRLSCDLAGVFGEGWLGDE